MSAGGLAQALARRKHNLGGSEEESVSLLLEANDDDVFIYDVLKYDDNKQARRRGVERSSRVCSCCTLAPVCALTPPHSRHNYATQVTQHLLLGISTEWQRTQLRKYGHVRAHHAAYLYAV